MYLVLDHEIFNRENRKTLVVVCTFLLLFISFEIITVSLWYIDKIIMGFEHYVMSVRCWFLRGEKRTGFCLSPTGHYLQIQRYFLQWLSYWKATASYLRIVVLRSHIDYRLVNCFLNHRLTWWYLILLGKPKKGYTSWLTKESLLLATPHCRLRGN